MFIYLSKKIAIPNNTKLHSIAWNREDGYIAVGGDDGLLKVLKLDAGGANDAGDGTGVVGSGRARGLAAASNLSMNQTLEGHADSIKVITWNDAHKKLTTSDANGVIIVWMLYKGAWYEEMINNRKKSTVVGMAWSYDGLKICIIYEDGAVIVGSVDGNRIWGKELKGVQLAGVQWSPDAKLLLFCLQNGQVHLYDNQGNFVMRLEMQPFDAHMSVRIVGLDWYNGRNGYMHALCPCLAICYENGRIQLMNSETDPTPVIVDTLMTAAYCSWNHNGTLLAVAGRQVDHDRESNVVQFYSPFGDHLRTLRVPGYSIACCVWEGGSLRVALAVDSFVYFANIRPDYKWCYFKKTIVYTSCRPQKAGVCVSFWDTTNNQCHTRYVPVLLGIAAFGDHCVLVTKNDADQETTCGFSLLLFNTLGTIIDGYNVDIEPLCVAINSTHVIAADRNNFLVWQYKTPKSYGIAKNRMKCRRYHVDDNPSGAVEVIHDLEQSAEITMSTHATSDPICAIAASDRTLIVGRESGTLQHYALPHSALCNRYKLATRPHKIAINCNSTRMAIIDVSGVLTVMEISENSLRANQQDAGARLERKDVWAMCWASDNPQSLAIMEKTRMYVFKGNHPEEPIASSGYICNFNDLEIEAVLLDEVMEQPEKPARDQHLLKLEVKSLRDTRVLLEKVGIAETAQFIEDNPHPRLWRLLAEAALKEVNLAVAESAFIRSADYRGIAFVKKLHNISSDAIRKAYVATYFKQFDEAEKLFTDSDRRDLALALRQTLGDWFRVIQIMKNGVSAPDLVLEVAYNSAAEYFAQFSNWSAAVEYYELAKNRAEMIECYYHLEDYTALENMIESLPDGDPLLQSIADMFAADAVYSVAVKALLRLGNVKAAVDLCILHNKWDQAIDLAKEYDLPQINALFTKYTQHLVEREMLASAVEINVRARQFASAAELAFQFAKQEAKRPQRNLLRVKKLFVYAAQLANHDGGHLHYVDANVWSGAEAYHYFMLAHEQLYANKLRDAMNTAFKLQEYTAYLDDIEVYKLLALIACQHQAFGVCSTAFIKLKSLELTENELVEVNKLAYEIFTLHEPNDDDFRRKRCVSCHERLCEWSTSCPSCSSTFPTCIASGEPLQEKSTSHWICKVCHHIAQERLMNFRKFCPLCHAQI